MTNTWKSIQLALAIAGIATAAYAATPPAFTGASLTVQENAGVANFVVTKSAKGKSYSQIRVQTFDGTAVAGTGYGAVNKILTFGNNTMSMTVPITIIDNTTFDGNKAFTVRLTCIRNCSLASNVASVVSIVDNETQAPPPTPVFGTMNQTVRENASQVVIAIQKTGLSASPSLLTVRTIDGTAKSGVDYAGISIPVSVPGNAAGTSVAIPIMDNTTYQGDRSFKVEIIPGANAALPAGYSPSAVTINDDEIQPPPPIDCGNGIQVPAGTQCPVPSPDDPNQILNPPSPIEGAKVCRNWYTTPIGTMCPTIFVGDTVTATQACVSGTMPDPLIVGASYKVLGLYADMPIGTGIGIHAPSGVILNPVIDDGIHRGDGWAGLHVAFSCVAKPPTASRLMAAPSPMGVHITNPVDARLKFTTSSPIRTAVKTCRNAMDTTGMGVEFVTVKGRRYRLLKSAHPEMVFVKPVEGKPTKVTPLVMRSCLAS